MFSNFLYFLIALIIYTTAGLFEDTTAFEGGVLTDAFLVNLVFVLICHGVFKRIERKIGQVSLNMIDRQVSRSTARLSILALVVFAVDIYGFRLHLYLSGVTVFEIFPTLGALLFLSLFLAYLAIIWGASYSVQRAVFNGVVSKKEFVLSNISFSLPALFPWFILSLTADLLAMVEWAPLKKFLSTMAGELTYIGVFVAAIAVFAPVLIKRLWHCKPLDDPAVKRKLEAICHKTGLKYADILKWDLFGGHMITAGVMGLVGRFRYILVTPALLNSLNDEQIEAVMLHEIGHVQKHHMLFYLLFFAGFIVCSVLFFEPLGLLLYILPVYGIFQFIGIDQFTAHSIMSSLVLIILFILYFRLVFGLYMRNFERQADLHIFNFKSDAIPMITTFYRIAAYSRQAMDKPNWHHFSIGQRIRFLEKCQAFPQLINRHHAKVKKMILYYFVTAIAICLMGYSINYGFAKEPFHDYVNKTWLFQQLDLHPENSDLYAMVGDHYFSREEFKKAIDAYENVLRVDPVNFRALNNLSMLFSTCTDEAYRNGPRAVELARKALLQDNGSIAWDTYAEALAFNKDYILAVTASEKALELATERKKFYQEQLIRFEKLAASAKASQADG